MTKQNKKQKQKQTTPPPPPHTHTKKYQTHWQSNLLTLAMQTVWHSVIISTPVHHPYSTQETRNTQSFTDMWLCTQLQGKAIFPLDL